MSKNRRLFKSPASTILFIYLISLFCAVAMFYFTGPARYIFCGIAFVGFVAAAVLSVVKIIKHFKDENGGY